MCTFSDFRLFLTQIICHSMTDGLTHLLAFMIGIPVAGHTFQEKRLSSKSTSAISDHCHRLMISIEMYQFTWLTHIELYQRQDQQCQVNLSHICKQQLSKRCFFCAGIISIGGAHLKPAKTLPTDLQKYIDEAPHGVIYFSLGTVIKTKDLPKEKLQIYMSELIYCTLYGTL